MFASEIHGYRPPVAFDAAPKREEKGMNKAVLITWIVLAVLALIPVASACGLDAEAYKACVDKCRDFIGSDYTHELCIMKCQNQFLNPYC